MEFEFIKHLKSDSRKEKKRKVYKNRFICIPNANSLCIFYLFPLFFHFHGIEEFRFIGQRRFSFILLN